MSSSSRTIRVAPKRTRTSYAVTIQPGILSTLPRMVTSRYQESCIFVVTDTNIKKLYGRKLLAGLLSAGMESWLIDFPAGEASKNAPLVNSLHTQLLEHGVRRDSLIVALGGGVVGDLAGYVAATILRGVRYLHVPTTLLAQVDSSIGGKVGINHPLGKNLIGAFHEPEAVYIDPDVLSTLPGREFRSGLAEVVKIAAGLDARFFLFLERNVDGIRKKKGTLLAELIARSVRLKSAVVQKDEFETGLRKTLNLGHTIGHAIESASSYKLRHGEAVALGLAAESRIARDMGLLSTKDFARLLKLIHALGLPVSFPQVKDRRKFLSSLSLDKKSTGASPKFVLLKSIGCSIVGVDVPSPFIHAILNYRR